MASDFHTHTYRDGVTALVSIPYPGSAGKGLWSLEFHPWNLEPVAPEELPPGTMELLEKATALGEIGLDRMRGPTAPVQRSWMRLLLKAAAELNKPIVFHCVRMIPELLSDVRPYSHLPRLVHAFRASPELLEELRNEGFYVSLSPAVLVTTHMMDYLRSTGLERIGFETDTSPEPIDAIMERAANKLKLSKEELERITDNTFQEFLSGVSK